MNIVIGNWDMFMKSLQYDIDGEHIVLTEKEYLLDAKEKIDKIILSSKIPIKDYRVTGIFNSYLIGSKIIDAFVLSKDFIGHYKSGLTVIFEKGNERGIIIYQYNDSGEGIDFLQAGNKVIKDLPNYSELKIFHKIDELIKEYHIMDENYHL